MQTAFGIPGLGAFAVDAINSQDFALVRTVVFPGTLLYIVGSLLTDISYALVDPRVRLESLDLRKRLVYNETNISSL